MTLEAESALLLEIARCPHVRECITNSAHAHHPCSEIVRSQGSKVLNDQQVPEPWLGNLAKAPVLFVSSNPGISWTEHYPRWSWPDDAILSYFSERFAKWIRNGTDYRKQDGTFEYVQYWVKIRARARELYNRDVTPGRDYALSEIVHCKSTSEEDGVEGALKTCADRYLHRMLLLSESRIVVIVGKSAKDSFVDKYRLVKGACASHEPAEIAGRERFVVFIAHPNARRSSDPKTFAAEEFLPFLPRLRGVLTGGTALAAEPEMRIIGSIPGSVLSGTGDNRRRSPSIDHDTKPIPYDVIRVLTRENPKRDKSRLRFDCYRE
jgi:uracil-DNA glycosylase